MTNTTIKSGMLVVTVVLCLASSAFSQTVNFEITSPNPNNLAGVYTDPYNALINNTTSIEAFCDDFTDEVTPPETWTALVTNLSQFTATPSVSSVYFTTGAGATQTQDYIAAAILASEGLQSYQNADPTMANDLSFALWGVFDPSILTNANPAGLPSNDLMAAQGYLSAALTAAGNQTGAAYEASSGDNVVIYSATTNGTTPQGPGSNRPQEFITVVHVAEPPSPAILGINLLGLGFLILFFRRRSVSAAN